MQPVPGNNIAGRGGPKWQRFTVVESDFTAAAAAESITLFSLPSTGTVHAVLIQHTVSFTGGTIADYTIEVGISGDEDKYTGGGTQDVFQAIGATVFKLDTVVGLESLSGATDILITARCASDDVADATAGAVTIWVLTSEPDLIP